MSNRDPKRWTIVKEAFAEAMERPKSQRGSFLLRHYSGDPELVAEVHRLAVLAEESRGFLSGPRTTELEATLEREREIAGRYRIVRNIGAGGMSGGVYEAIDERSGRRVALKSIEDRSEFLLAERIRHPNVCRVFECARDADGSLYLIMELLRGETLEDRLASGRRLQGRAFFEFAEQLCAGVEAMHRAGVLHADLKPANVFIGMDGRAAVTDFGLSRTAISGSAGLPGQIAGTLPYMAPELLAGRPASTRSDIYSLGIVLHEAATGKLPLDGGAAPRSAGKIVSKCLEMNPRNRPPSAAAVAKALRKAHGILRFWFPKTSPRCWMPAKPEAQPLGSVSTRFFTNSSGARS